MGDSGLADINSEIYQKCFFIFVEPESQFGSKICFSSSRATSIGLQEQLQSNADCIRGTCSIGCGSSIQGWGIDCRVVFHFSFHHEIW